MYCSRPQNDSVCLWHMWFDQFWLKNSGWTHHVTDRHTCHTCRSSFGFDPCCELELGVYQVLKAHQSLWSIWNTCWFCWPCVIYTPFYAFGTWWNRRHLIRCSSNYWVEKNHTGFIHILTNLFNFITPYLKIQKW